MKVFSLSYKFLTLMSLFVTIYSVLDEGNIFLPMTSNFTLEHSQSKLNQKNYYTIGLKVGTPGEEYQVQLDTSTSTSWIPSTQCKNCKLARRMYDEEDSRTSSPTSHHIEIEDEDGNVEGYQTSDNIKLGDYKLKQYGFVQVTKVADDFKDHYQGKLGLGYKSHYLKDEEFNFLEKLKKNNLIAKKIFTINAINDKSGMLFIGDVPGKEYHTFCNVTEDTEQFDDLYKESWICELSHIGLFDIKKGISDRIKSYDRIEHTTPVSFDSAYDFISVPISEKEEIEAILKGAGLKCTENKENPYKKNTEDKTKLRNIVREEEITITCETNIDELNKKNLALSFVLQGHAYSLPLNSLFVPGKKKNEMKMLIKYIDSKDAIWTLGYPFMNQFLMIFNMEENHVGIKKLKKTSLPIVTINAKDWSNYNLKEDSSTASSAFRIIGYIIILLVVMAISFFAYKAIRKVSIDDKRKNTQIEGIIF